jgi:hypothetical protein
MSYFQAKHGFINHTIPYNQGKDLIDLLVIDPKTEVILDCVIKGYVQNRMSEAKFTAICRQHHDLKRELKIQTMTGDALWKQYSYQRLVVMPDIACRDYWLNRFLEQKIVVKLLPVLLQELKEMVFADCQLETDAILTVIKQS